MVAGPVAAPDNAGGMIPKPLKARQIPDWQRALQDSFTRPQDLLDHLGLRGRVPLPPARIPPPFPLRVPRAFVERMRPGDPDDPLFLQVWPRAAEAEVVPGFEPDAVGDLARLHGEGLIHKYQGRALVIATGACAVHCRYCFRQHFPYGEQRAARDGWRALLDRIAADPSLEEIILSGGDPLSLADDKLAALVAGLEAIPHVRRLRLHTRQPVVLPERVDAGLLAWMTATRLQTVVVLHINHPQEIDEALRSAIGRLRETGATLLNQSVLLRGINDRAAVLQALSEALFACGVLPYYLHLLDRVAGAAHFEVPEDEALRLMQQLSASLPGYLVPRLAREEAGQPAKTTLAWTPTPPSIPSSP